MVVVERPSFLLECVALPQSAKIENVRNGSQTKPPYQSQVPLIVLHRTTVWFQFQFDSERIKFAARASSLLPIAWIKESYGTGQAWNFRQEQAQMENVNIVREQGETLPRESANIHCHIEETSAFCGDLYL